jgi:hypothetical protein
LTDISNMSDKTDRYPKIASAIYLITGFFADQEPLKWRLRGLAGDLASEQVLNKPAVSRELVTLFGLARAAGLVSDANHDILARELARISEEASQPLAFLAETASQPTETPREPVRESLPAAAPVPAAPSTPPVIKDNLPEQKTGERPALKEFGAVSVKKNSRQSTIIALLKRKKEIMIKDVSPLIPGCSEKTIQRELSEMVETGILRKLGAKRWTRYTLA